MKATLAALAFAGFAATTFAAQAAPVAIEADGAPVAVTKVATFVCVRDDRGWHYMRGSRRVTCRPAIPREGARFWAWRCEGPRCGWWHRHDRRWHD